MNSCESSIASFVLVGAAFVSLAVYYVQHRRTYGDGRTKAAARAPFSKVTDAHIRLSTITVGLASCWLEVPVFLQFFRGTSGLIGGASLVVFAEVLFVWSMASLRHQYSPCYDAYVPTELVTTGPYRFVRHPIYSANILLLIGVSLMTGALILLVNVGILAVAYVRAARQEEEYLGTVDASWTNYVTTTGMFFPRFFAAKSVAS